MERSLHHQMASIENIICGALSGVVFGMFSGQPLNILSATGPTLIFERILYDFCTYNLNPIKQKYLYLFSISEQNIGNFFHSGCMLVFGWLVKGLYRRLTFFLQYSQILDFLPSIACSN